MKTDLVQRLDEFKQNKDKYLREMGEVIGEAMSSDDPYVLVKAHEMYDEFKLQAQYGSSNDRKSVVFDPFSYNSGENYRLPPSNIPPNTLRRMGASPLINAIITKRIDQVVEFTKPQESRFEPGFKIVKVNPNGTTQKEDEMKKADRVIVEKVTSFLLACGDDPNRWGGDNFETFVRKCTRDSLEQDKATFEVVRNRRNEVVEFFSTDGSTMFLTDVYKLSQDPSVKKIKGYYPTYAQVVRGKVVADFYPWELGFGIRNGSTNIVTNGYGKSELENLVQVITWMLYSDQYNGNFFSNGSHPKGLLRGKNVNRGRIREFRQQWQAVAQGVNNAWKVPIISADEFEWIDMQKSNRDMEFSSWQEYLIKISCATFRMDPSEVGFHLSGSAGSSAMFESNVEGRLKFSRDNGLRPLLRFWERMINDMIIHPLTNSRNYRLQFVGLNAESEAQELEADVKRGQAFMGVKELRRKYNLPADLAEGDVILNPTYLQFLGQQQMAEQQGEEGGQEPEDPFAQTSMGSFEDDDENLYKAIMQYTLKKGGAVN